MDKWLIKRPRISNDVASLERDVPDDVENSTVRGNKSPESIIQCFAPTNHVNDSSKRSERRPEVDSDFRLLDISLHFERKLTDEEKYQILKNRWIPDELHTFPVSGQRNLKFQRKWFQEFTWLVYSEKLDGAFCRFCIFFSPKDVGKGTHTPVKSLVTLAFRRWKDAKEQFRIHQDLNYHKTAIAAAQSFIDVKEGRIVDISLQLDTVKRAEIQRNRAILKSIVDTIIFIGRQEIALRGHRDAGPITLQTPLHNDGNFRSLLRFRMDSGDSNLMQHLLQTGTSNRVTSYTSPQIQNELIEICGKIILETLVAKINKSKCCTILADGTTDISGVEQYSLCFRYTEEVDNETILREDFLTFVPIEDGSGRGLASSLLGVSKKLGIILEFMVSQGYDGAAVMSGEWNGCAAAVMEQYPSALYVHCASHSLNLAVGEACSVPLIRNCLGSIQQIITFFRPSAKREAILADFIEKLDCATTRERLMKLCETRWTERLDAVITFKDMFVPIFKSLEKMQESSRGENAKNAFSHYQTLKSGAFIVAMVVINEIFSHTHPLTVYLQSTSIDLACAVSTAEDLVELLENSRSNASSAFRKVFVAAEQIADAIEVKIEKPRVVQRQKHRENFDSTSAEEYFRKSVFIPFIDHFICALKDRFVSHKRTLSMIQNIIPNKLVKLGIEKGDENELLRETLCKTVEALLVQWPKVTTSVKSITEKEILLWRQRWIAAEKRPQTFIDALNLCDKELFRNVHKFLKIGATLAVTIASNERSFSTLRRLKDWQRNAIGEERLNGLALLSIHREIDLKAEEVINRFAEKKRKFDL